MRWHPQKCAACIRSRGVFRALFVLACYEAAQNGIMGKYTSEVCGGCGEGGRRGTALLGVCC